MIALPTKHFAFPPFTAEPSGGENDWWHVANCQGFNCLSFPDKPGAKFTTEAHARATAERWNKDESVHYRA